MYYKRKYVLMIRVMKRSLRHEGNVTVIAGGYYCMPLSRSSDVSKDRGFQPWVSSGHQEAARRRDLF